MMSHYEQVVHDKLEIVSKNIKSDNTLKYATIHESIKSRLQNILKREQAMELFENDLLNFDELDHAKTINDVTDIIDKYLEITDFYVTNYRTFSWLIKEEAIREQLRHGDINCWNEILLRRGINYKRLSSEQSRTYIMSILSQSNRKSVESKMSFVLEKIADSKEEQTQLAESNPTVVEAVIAPVEVAKEDNEKIEAEKLEAQKREIRRLEAERVRVEAEKLAAEKLEAERLAAEKLEAERIEAERLAAEKLAAEKLEAEKLEAAKREAEKINAEILQTEINNSNPPSIAIDGVIVSSASDANVPTQEKSESTFIPILATLDTDSKTEFDLIDAAVDDIIAGIATAKSQASPAVTPNISNLEKSSSLEVIPEALEQKLSRAPSPLVSRPSVEQPVVLDLRKREFTNRLVDLINDIYKLLNDTGYWHKKMGPVCAGSKIKITKDNKKKKVKIPNGVKSMREALPTIGNLFTTSEDNQLNQAMRCLSVMIDNVPKHANVFCLYSHHGTENKLYHLIKSLKPALLNELNYKEKNILLKKASDDLHELFIAKEEKTPSNELK